MSFITRKEPKPAPSSMGTETSRQLLPQNNSDDVDYSGPNYQYIDNLPSPEQAGVYRGDSMSSVMQAASGVAYYIDMVGTGRQTELSAGKPVFPLGINYFYPTGLTCSNGAQMWKYIKGIPEGNNRGIAAGMIDDATEALNPSPLVRAAIGNVYADCVQETQRIGDFNGKTRAPDGKDWFPGQKIDMKNGVPMQTRWVQRKTKEGMPIYITSEQYDKTPKTHNFDGSPKKEGFCNQDTFLLLGTAGLLSVAAYFLRKK